MCKIPCQPRKQCRKTLTVALLPAAVLVLGGVRPALRDVDPQPVAPTLCILRPQAPLLFTCVFCAGWLCPGRMAAAAEQQRCGAPGLKWLPAHYVDSPVRQLPQPLAGEGDHHAQQLAQQLPQEWVLAAADWQQGDARATAG